MEIDLRIVDYNNYAEAAEIDVDCISLGDEGCVYRLPDPFTLKKILLSLLSIKVKPRLVTPKVGESELEIVLQLVKTAAEFGDRIDLIVNDLGVLQFSIEIASKMNIYFGRVFARSIIDCPWYQFILRKEIPEVRDGFTKHAYDHKEKIDLLRSYNIKGIEVNNLSGIEKSILQITRNNTEVNAHYGRRLLTLGRGCITARHFDLGIKKCLSVCGTEFQLDWDGLWLSSSQSDVQTSEVHKRLLHGAVVNGNRVLAPCTNTLAEMLQSGVSKIIVDQEPNMICKIMEIRKTLYALQKSQVLT